MATDMEKDALLEFLSGTYVNILRAEPKDQESLDALLHLKTHLYGTHGKKINYVKTLNYIKRFRARVSE